MDASTQITLKQLDFIDDVQLREVLRERLDELDRIVPANANYGTVFLAIGIIEGIFKHFASLYKAEILGISPPDYPETSPGKRKEFDKLIIEEIYHLLSKAGAKELLAEIPEYDRLFELFRKYRNYVHPQEQARQRLQVGLGQAQMALGLLNATIQSLDRNIIVGKQLFEKVAGIPRSDSQGMIDLPRAGTRHHSFIVLRKPVDSRLQLTFNADISPHGLLNFVFDYTNPGDFRMLRFDTRPDERCRNGVLRSTQRYWWNYELHAVPAKAPANKETHVRIDIDFQTAIFTCIVDGAQYAFINESDGTPSGLSEKVHPGRRIGFFNEEDTVKISNLTIKVS
jgi:hypothetical protein